MSNNKTEQKTKTTEKDKKVSVLKVLLIVLACFIFLPMLWGGTDRKTTTNNSANNYPQADTTKDTTAETTPEIKQTNYTLGETFTLKEYYGESQVTLGNYSFASVANKYSDYYGQTVIKIPVTEVNKGNKAGRLSMYGNYIYKPDGTETQWSVGALFNDSMIKSGGNLQPNATQTTYLYFIYGGNGEYTIDFNSGEAIVKFNVTR